MMSDAEFRAEVRRLLLASASYGAPLHRWLHQGAPHKYGVRPDLDEIIDRQRLGGGRQLTPQVITAAIYRRYVGDHLGA